MKRNYGIDLLRMAAMVFVAVLHIIGIGGIITGAQLLSPQFLTAQLLRIAMLCAVNCYALISGFVGWERKPKWSGLVMLWLKAVLVCLCITWFFSRNHDFDYKTWLSALLPVTTGQYWYLTAYAGLFVLMPLLNFAVQNMPEKELRMALAGILTLFCVLPISPLTDAFYLHDGYSVLWLALMYLLGGYLGKYDVPGRLSGKIWTAVYALSVLAAWGSRMLVLYWKPIYWSMGYGNILIEYNSPSIVLAAVALVAIFSRLRLADGAARAVAKCAPHAFGVYLLHAHPLVFRFWLEGNFSDLGTASIAGMIAAVLGWTGAICLVGLGFDWGLTGCMKLLRIDRLLKRLDRMS